MRPLHLSKEHAERFMGRGVAELYGFRPNYSLEVYITLLSLLSAGNRTVLDVGCGPGKLARGLVGDVAGVDAVDFSAEMIRVGKGQLDGDHPNIAWQCAPLETARLRDEYGLIVAGASLHWMDWEVVLPRFARVLAADGFLAVVDGDGPYQAPWSAERRALIAEYSTNQDYQPFDLIAELVDRGLFTVAGRHETEPVAVTQTIDEFLNVEHSRESLALNAMGEQRAAEFDDGMRAVLLPFSVDGQITYRVRTWITWGKPLASKR